MAKKVWVYKRKNVEKAMKFLELAGKTTQRELNKIAKDLAKIYKDRLLKNLTTEGIGLPRLDLDYKEEKKKAGLDTRIYIKTGELKRRLRLIKIPDGTGWVVGYKKGVKHSSGSDLATIAAALEFGRPSQNLPKRPVFKITGLQLRKQFRKILKVRMDLFVKRISK